MVSEVKLMLGRPAHARVPLRQEVKDPRGSQRREDRGHPDWMSALEGGEGHGNVHVVKEVA